METNEEPTGTIPASLTDEPTKPVKMEIVQPPGGVQHIYANFVSLGVTSHDMMIWFGKLYRVLDLPDAEPLNRVEQRAAVSLSWSEAKHLRNSLSDVIEKFEKVNGEINATPTIPPKI